jgi:hypothetical protein
VTHRSPCLCFGHPSQEGASGDSVGFARAGSSRRLLSPHGFRPSNGSELPLFTRLQLRGLLGKQATPVRRPDSAPRAPTSSPGNSPVAQPAHRNDAREFRAEPVFPCPSRVPAGRRPIHRGLASVVTRLVRYPTTPARFRSSSYPLEPLPPLQSPILGRMPPASHRFLLWSSSPRWRLSPCGSGPSVGPNCVGYAFAVPRHAWYACYPCPLAGQRVQNPYLRSWISPLLEAGVRFPELRVTPFGISLPSRVPLGTRSFHQGLALVVPRLVRSPTTPALFGGTDTA